MRDDNVQLAVDDDRLLHRSGISNPEGKTKNDGRSKTVKTADEEITLFRKLTMKIGDRTLLKEQDLRVSKGTITILMGPSGIGKSMLSDAVFNVEVRGTHTTRSDNENESGLRGALVFQDGGGLPHLNVGDNLALTGASRERCSEMMRVFELSSHTMGGALSGGERRRLAVTRALLTQREWLWLDEPDAGLDIERLEELARTLREQAETHGLAMVVVTHSVKLAAAIADRVIVLGEDGKLHEIGYDLIATGTEAIERAVKKTLEHSSEGKGEDTAQRLHTEAPRVKDNPLRWLLQIAYSAAGAWAIARERQARMTLKQTFVLSAIKGALYYPFIGSIFGGVFVLVFTSAVPPFITVKKVLSEFGPSIVMRFSPPISAILIAACAGSTISAWVGQMAAGRQLDALQVIGVDIHRRVLAPIWWGLSTGAIVNTLTFAMGITTVFAAYISMQGDMEANAAFWNAWSGGKANEGLRHLLAAGLKTVGYAMLVAAVSIGTAATVMRSQREVAAAVTRGIVYSSVMVMTAELLILMFNYVI